MPHAAETSAQKQLLVVKYGSASVTDERGMDVGRLAHHADQLVAARQRYDLIVVSSGSVAVGRALWAHHGSETTPSSQTLAMLGSPRATMAWQQRLAEHGLLASQLLVTHREIDEAGTANAMAKALADNRRDGVIPIINENDAVSVEELAKFSYNGDNDGLARHVAQRQGAAVLALLTEAPGVLDDGQLVPVVGYDVQVHAYAKGLAGEPNGKGRGGMYTKIEAAIAAAESGIDAYIGAADDDLADILAGQAGTHFEPNPDAG